MGCRDIREYGLGDPYAQKIIYENGEDRISGGAMGVVVEDTYKKCGPNEVRVDFYEAAWNFNAGFPYTSFLGEHCMSGSLVSTGTEEKAAATPVQLRAPLK